MSGLIPYFEPIERTISLPEALKRYAARKQLGSPSAVVNVPGLDIAGVRFITPAELVGASNVKNAPG